MPGENRAAIDALILESRRNLLDLSLRNRMLNHRVTKTRDIEVVGGQPAEILRALVTGQSALGFAGVDDEPPAGGQDSLALEPTVRRLQTRIAASELQLRLLKIHVDARTALEEQGANLLYLALGMVEWFESPEAEEPRRAPLLLVPVALQRSGSDRFTLRYSGEDVGTNLSFAAKLKDEYRVDLPTLADDDDIDVAAYFDAVESAISGIDRWRVARDKVVLGFFTFARFLMYRDLDPAGWPVQDGPGDHPVMDALVTRFSDLDCPLSESAFLDDLRPVGEVHEVVDADSSQVLALEDVKAGRTLVIEGPPGTGKSQTITNLIAEAAGLAGAPCCSSPRSWRPWRSSQRNLERRWASGDVLPGAALATRREQAASSSAQLEQHPRGGDAPRSAILTATHSWRGSRRSAHAAQRPTTARLEVVLDSLITPHQAHGPVLATRCSAWRPAPRRLSSPRSRPASGATPTRRRCSSWRPRACSRWRPRTVGGIGAHLNALPWLPAQGAGILPMGAAGDSGSRSGEAAAAAARLRDRSAAAGPRRC
jgi:hypothetical protein